MTKKQMECSLLEQLELQGKTGNFYTDLVSDYMYYWQLKKELIKDIKNKGIRYKTVNGNGISVDKANESVINLPKTTAIMLKILTDLNLKIPVKVENPEDGYM